MDSLPASVADAYALLRTDLYRHLDDAEFLAAKHEAWSERDTDAARALIPDLLQVIRGLLAEHGPDRAGVCRVCAVNWPCPVVSTIRDLLKDPDRQFVALLVRPSDSPYSHA
jgi:hypothetical protein